MQTLQELVIRALPILNRAIDMNNQNYHQFPSLPNADAKSISIESIDKLKRKFKEKQFKDRLAFYHVQREMIYVVEDNFEQWADRVGEFEERLGVFSRDRDESRGRTMLHLLAHENIHQSAQKRSIPTIIRTLYLDGALGIYEGTAIEDHLREAQKKKSTMREYDSRIEFQTSKGYLELGSTDIREGVVDWIASSLLAPVMSNGYGYKSIPHYLAGTLLISKLADSTDFLPAINALRTAPRSFFEDYMQGKTHTKVFEALKDPKKGEEAAECILGQLTGELATLPKIIHTAYN